MEEIGIPEIWQNLKEIEETEPLNQTIKTKNHGEFPKTEINALWMFWNLMRNRGFKWTDLCRQFCDYYGVTWQVMTSMKAMIDSYLIKDDLSQEWRYIGPSFDEPTGAIEAPTVL